MPARSLPDQRVWQRLWECPASNRAKVLGWRLQHASLPCGLYLAAKRGRPGEQRHLCGQPSCAQGPLQWRPRDSLSHIFLQCPAYEPARQWLHDLWVAVTGGPGPPVSCSWLMLGDLPAAWASYPRSAGLAALWQTLRLTLLHAIWTAHSAADVTSRSAAMVVQQSVGELQRLMRSQFRMAALSDDTLNSLPTRMLTAELRATPLEAFKAAWAHGGVLCCVDEPPGLPPLLRLHLSLGCPVLAPTGMASQGHSAGSGAATADTPPASQVPSRQQSSSRSSE